MHPFLAKSMHEILGGRLNDGRNNILKSPQLTKADKDFALFVAEPYDDAFKTNHMDNVWESYDRLERTVRRRRKKLFEALGVTRINVTVYDDMQMISSFDVIKKEV